MTKQQMRDRLKEVSEMTCITDDVRFALKMVTVMAYNMVRHRKNLAHAKANFTEESKEYIFAKHAVDKLQKAIYAQGHWVYSPMPANTPREEYRFYRQFWTR